MIIRREDSAGDFVFGHSSADYLTENDAIGLLVKDRLLLWLGEWFLDITQGVNWWPILGSKPPLTRYAHAEVRRIILGTDGVTEITDLQMAFDHKTFTLDMRVEVSTIFTKGLLIRFQQTLQVGGQ